ncbi:DNA-binding helix-hairpin-helix protein with protein kinase domain [Sphingomonas insulae]|uniref:Protein kinase YegI n=1 Tax=Sphingomonas insulae TaxID=424800 RepID=A0ABN1HTR2_9SPHN|nr:topoisomerase DNA-binding C4 zinc finger domain-containing protein [Sphingomonas insulae]NIJ28187.1 DNA-binding helix-hairpin-helix protein with protein kinase domain [Sphingomonas insulae]
MTPLYIGGRPVRLGERVGRGGEGEVFVLADRPDQAIKLYGSPDDRRREKIEAMVAAGLAARSDLVAFPVAMVQGPGGAFAGFAMRLVRGHKPLFELYAPGARKVAFPEADYRFLVRSAANVAVAVAKVHEAGVVVGDINHSGILVSDRATAALIDADSFQFGERHLCRVGVPEYTPPELQSRRLDGIVRTPEHDAFGLAIVIFQLLFMGRHPFVGRYRGSGDMPIERAIAEHRFAYSARGRSDMSPPPGAARLQEFPDEIGAMFEAAFGGAPSARPRPPQWAEALRRLEGGLSRCSRNDIHYFPSAAGGCSWCRMERESGIVLFVAPLPKGAARSDPGAAGFDLAGVWRSIQAVRLPAVDGLLPPLTQTAPQSSSEVAAFAGAIRTRRRSGLALLLVAAALLGWSGDLWLLCLPLAWWGYHLTWQGGSDLRRFVERHGRARSAYEAAVVDWRKRIGIEEAVARRRTLEKAKSTYDGLPGEEKRRLGELTTKRRENQLRRHMESFPLRRAKIRGIGAGKLATLASYGIDTAAQVRRDRVLAIPGFGPVNSQELIAWRASVESRFVYNPSPTQQDRQDEDRVRREIANEAGRLRGELSSGAADLRATAAAVEQRMTVSDPVVNRAYHDLEQARIDLEALGTAAPTIAPSPAPTTLSGGVGGAAWKPTRPPKPVAGTPACPSCGGPMIRRAAHRGARTGRPFMGCARYPTCRGTRST